MGLGRDEVSHPPFSPEMVLWGIRQTLVSVGGVSWMKGIGWVLFLAIEFRP